jgi:hypothetical protein
VNARIAEKTEQNIRWYSSHPESIPRRLGELEREWDIERTLEANAASVSLLGLALGAAVNRKFFVLPAIVAGFLLQHALQGWCPPVPILRRRGVRTQTEIESERCALQGTYAEAGNKSRSAVGERSDAINADLG